MSKYETMPLLLSLIDRGSDTQVRTKLNDEAIADYRFLIEEKRMIESIPLLDVFFDGITYHIADGWHRFEAACEAGLESLTCRIHQGSERDARIFACQANQKHGVRRTQADKRRAIELMLEDQEWSEKSSKAIADHVGVDHKTVERVRQERSEGQLGNSQVRSEEAPTRTGADGKKRKAPTPKDSPSASKSDEPAPALSKKNPENKSGDEKISPAQRKQARNAFGVVVRFVDLCDEPEVAKDLELIAEAMKPHWA